MVVHPIEGCSSSSEGTYTGCALRETALGDDANSKLQLRSGRSFASLFQPPSAGDFQGSLPSLQHFQTESQRQEPSFVLKPSLPDLKLSNRAGDNPPGSWAFLGPHVVGRKGSRAVASPGSGPPSALQGTAPKRGNFRDRGCSQANQRTAVAARPARKDAVNNAIATPHWSKSRPQSRSPGRLLLLLDES